MEDGFLEPGHDKGTAKIDELIGKVDAMPFGPSAISTRLALREKWIRQLAKKAGVALDV